MAAEEFDIQKKYERKKEEERQREKGIVEDKKRVVQVIKLYVSPNSAKPGPPLGPILGQAQINTNEFCSQFNKLTEKMDPQLVLPVILYKKADRTFDITLRAPTTSFYIRRLRRKLSELRRVKPTIGGLAAGVFGPKLISMRENHDYDLISSIKIFRSLVGSLKSAKMRPQPLVNYVSKNVSRHTGVKSSGISNNNARRL